MRGDLIGFGDRVAERVGRFVTSVALLGLTLGVSGCEGDRLQSACETVAAAGCQPLDECLQSGDEQRTIAEERGCTSEFDAFLACLDDEVEADMSCERIGTLCTEQQAEFDACRIESDPADLPQYPDPVDG